MRPNIGSLEEIESLRSALAAVGPLRRDMVRLPETDLQLEVARPADFDHLLDAAAADPEQNLPYWAELWPSGIALAADIERRPSFLAGKRVLELGCGLGVTAISALRAGVDLLATDYAPEALALCALNALEQVGRQPSLRQVNWRNPSPDFWRAAQGGFPLVLAADVLYEARDVAPLLALVVRLVLPGGELWLAEPGRRPADAFLIEIAKRGWVRETERWSGPWPDIEDNVKGVVVAVHKLHRPVV